MTRRPELPREHPPPELIEDLVLGSLGRPSRALLESHLAHCPSCREYLAELSRVGSAFVDSVVRDTATASGEAVRTGEEDRGEGEAEVPNSGLWQRLQRQLDDPEERWRDLPLPAAVRAELGGVGGGALEWQPIGPSEVALVAAEPESEILLHLVSSPAEETFPRHRHVGGEELVVLQGGLIDPVGPMQVGDFRAYPPGSEHAPVMHAGITCLALVLTRGGVEFL